MKALASLRSKHISWSRCLAIGLLLVLLAPPLHTRASPEAGSNIHVTTTADELNTDGNCSLREAIRAANLNTAVDACEAGSGSDIIFLPHGTYTLSIPGKDEDEALKGDLDITANLRIIGQGAGITVIDGNGIDRVFHVIDPSTVAEFFHVTIQNGNADDATQYGGGSILNYGTVKADHCIFQNNTTTRIGGSIDNIGTLVVTNSTFHDNSAPDGGAIYNGGTAVVSSVTFYNNSGGIGGGAFDNYDIASLTNVTISGNTADTGGGIFSDGTLTLLNCTITGNSSGVTNRANPGDARVKGTIIANSLNGNDQNCPEINLTSEGYNLDSGNSCNFNTSSDLSNANPLLGPLGDNEGPTWTHALLAGSPAIDKGSSQDCPRFDQRGALRPADGDENGTAICDMGAFEFNGMFPKLNFLPVVMKK